MIFEEPYLPSTFSVTANEIMPVQGQMPLSFTINESVKRYLRELFGKLENHTVASKEELEMLLVDLHDNAVIPGIHQAIKNTHDDLDDIITYEAKSVKEWLSKDSRLVKPTRAEKGK